MATALDDPPTSLRPTWRESDRFVPRTFVQPVLRFMQVEAAAGVVMLVAAIAALVWANSPWHAAYETFLSTPVTLGVGKLVQLDDMTLHHWINDAAMSLFFLVAGLEIKRQLLRGELRDRKAAALPAMAALGGMIVPAIIYVIINAGHPGVHGWGIPVATDPFEVAEVIHHAITTDEPKLRYAMSWGGRELTEGRARITDEEWVDLGRAASDDEYYERFQQLFDLDIRPR